MMLISTLMERPSMPPVLLSTLWNSVERPSTLVRATTCLFSQYPFHTSLLVFIFLLLAFSFLNFRYGLGFGSVLCHAKKVTDGMISAAARALASCKYPAVLTPIAFEVLTTVRFYLFRCNRGGEG